MYYAIVQPAASAGYPSAAMFTGAVYDYITEAIVNPHFEQGYFIEPMDTQLVPENQLEILQYEQTSMFNEEQSDMPPIPVYRSLTKEDAYKAIEFSINYRKSQENGKNFTYTHSTSGAYEFYADSEAIMATQNQCLTMSDTDLIPTANGKWKTAQVESDGITPVYVSFTVAEFKNMAKTLFDRAASNFNNKENHLYNVRVIVNDPNSTVDDILGYDFSGGWM